MRIISGKFRGKKLQSPVGEDTRPTSDRTRQALFNVLDHRYALKYPGLQVLDAFAGTGALGIEALSRGAAFCTFVEASAPMATVLQSNLQPFPDQFEIFKGHIQHQALKNRSYGLVFLDPPYHKGLIDCTVQLLKKWGVISQETLVVAEMAKDEPLPACLKILSEHTYGGTRILFASL